VSAEEPFLWKGLGFGCEMWIDGRIRARANRHARRGITVIIRISRGQVRPDAEGDVVARLRAATEGRQRPEGLCALFIGRHLTSTGTELVAITVWRDAQAMTDVLGDGWESSRWLPGVDDELMTHSSVEHFETAVEDFDPVRAFAPTMALGRAQP
jgi:hypothetical protein